MYLSASAWTIGCVMLVAIGLVPRDSDARACHPPTIHDASTPAQVRAFFQSRRLKVVTLLGYSGAEYEDTAALVGHANAIFDQLDPNQTLVNIGATRDGIGALYEIAKKKGFATTGIVSTQARDSHATLSDCVDDVFYVEDAAWGGFLAGTTQLSPTSAAMVEVSDRLIAIGGGDVARDELTAAKARGKAVQFIPAEMNHALALEKAKRKGEAAPTDFKGAAHAVFGKAAAGQPAKPSRQR